MHFLGIGLHRRSRGERGPRRERERSLGKRVHRQRRRTGADGGSGTGGPADCAPRRDPRAHRLEPDRRVGRPRPEHRGGDAEPRLFGSADANVHHLLVPDKETWFAAFARNEIVMQYSTSPNSPLRRGLRQGRLGSGTRGTSRSSTAPARSTLCRTSPDADPSGYYTIFVMQLAERLYGLPTLEEARCSATTATRHR